MIPSHNDHSRFIDLSHAIENGMITYRGLPAPKICDYWTREYSRQFYNEETEFQIGKIEMVANTGTYLDSPFHRFADGKDLSNFLYPLWRTSKVCWSSLIIPLIEESLRIYSPGSILKIKLSSSIQDGTSTGVPKNISRDIPT